MRTNKFGTKIPENETEFWELYKAFQMHFIPMKDTNRLPVEVATFSVVKALFAGWNFDTEYPVLTERT